MMPSIFSTPRLSDNSVLARPTARTVDIEKTSEPFRLNVKCKIAYLARSDVWAEQVSGHGIGLQINPCFQLQDLILVTISLSYTFPSKKLKNMVQ